MSVCLFVKVSWQNFYEIPSFRHTVSISLLTRCANRCKIAYEWDEETQKIGEMDGMLCATGITALVSKILFGERNEEA